MNIYYNNSLVRDVKFFRNISYIYVIIYKDKSVYIGQSFAKVKEDLTALKALLETRKEFYGVPYDMAKI
jgi:hypothetical protein